MPTSAERKAVGDGLRHETATPDIETASDEYASRFEGPAGEWMLDVQWRMVSELVDGAAGGSLSVLEVGGGHAQLTSRLVGAGHRVAVHGSDLRCHRRRSAPGHLVSDLWQLPFADRSYDLVVAIRLLPHVELWQQLVAEMARVSRRFVLVDFPVRGAIHRLAPFLFAWKRKIEGNTRPYFDYSPSEVSAALGSTGFGRVRQRRQFCWPMVLHRALNRPAASQSLEALTRTLGVTRLIGSPCLMLAERAREE